MSSNSSSVSTGTNVSGGTTGSKFKSFASGTGAIATFTIISVAMFIAAFVNMSNFAGSKDDWNLIQPQIQKILIFTLIGTFGLIIAALLYFIQDPARTTYFVLTICCLSLGLSFSALAISAISR